MTRITWEVSEEDTVSAAIFKQQILERLDRDDEAELAPASHAEC